VRPRVPLLWIVIIALALRVLVITAGHTYKITPRRDHFLFANGRSDGPERVDSPRVSVPAGTSF